MPTSSVPLLSQFHDGVALRPALAPDRITPDIADTKSQFPTLFSRESWARYCGVKHGPQASLLASMLFDRLARLDGSDDGVLDIHGLNLDSASDVFGFGEVDALFDKVEGPFKNEIRADLDQLHHSSAMRNYRNDLFVTKVGENRFFAVAGATDATFMVTSVALNTAWGKAMQLHPEMPWMRVVTHAGYLAGRTNNPVDPDHQMSNIAVMQADLLVTGGVGVVASDAEMLIAPSGSVSDHVGPSEIDMMITAMVGLGYIAAAFFGKGRMQSTPPPMPGNGGNSPYKTQALAYPRAVMSRLVAQLRRAQENGQRFVTAYMGNQSHPTPQPPHVELGVELIPGARAVARAISGAFQKLTGSEGTRFHEVSPLPPSEALPGGVEAPTAIKRDHRMSGGFTPPHLPPEPTDPSISRSVEPTKPDKPAAGSVRDTDRQQGPSSIITWAKGLSGVFGARPTMPIRPNPAAAEIVATLKNELGRLPGSQDVVVHEVDSTVYASAKSAANRVSIRLPSMTTLDAARLMLRHLMPVLMNRAPVPLDVTVIFEPDVAFESLCRTHGFSAAARQRAAEGGIVRIHMDGHGVKKVDFTADDAAVLSINRITGGDLIDRNTLKVELTLPRSIVQDPAVLHQRLNAAKDQLLAALWRIDKTRVPEFIPPFQPLDL